jgi:hypothetical protein
MGEHELELLLKTVKDGDLSIDDALAKIKYLPFEDIGCAKIDHHRNLRLGYPEVIYGQSKTPIQIQEIAQKLYEKGNNVLITRASKEAYTAVCNITSKASYNELGRTITIEQNIIKKPESYIAIVAAGTSDLYVVEEAYETAKILGNEVKTIVDVGVAGIHRLFAHLDVIKNAKVVIVIAGMEGALASVIGGLVDKPVIAVPTSVGYGASFGGIAALLSMLNSCASGISVVNIDNGFGAAYNASIINHL